jgi:hypothetical protein
VKEVAEVSTGDARHGRRDNGLVAAEYAAVGDVDPRVGEHLLDVLGLDGIAAYLRPSIDLNPITRSSSLPKRPTDRLYVDRAHIATARDYVRRLAEEGEAAPPTPGAPPLNADEVEAAWAEIVAGYDRTADVFRSDPTSAPAPIDPTRETTRPEPRDRTEPRERAEPGDRTEPRGRPDWIRLPPPGAGSRKDDAEESSLLDGLDTFAAGLDDDEEGYTPPKAPPIPRPSMPSVLAVIGIVGGLLVFLQPTLMPMSERSAMLLGFTAVVSGFATLVWRLRPGDDEDDDGPDDGARV